MSIGFASLLQIPKKSESYFEKSVEMCRCNVLRFRLSSKSFSLSRAQLAVAQTSALRQRILCESCGILAMLQPHIPTDFFQFAISAFSQIFKFAISTSSLHLDLISIVSKVYLFYDTVFLDLAIKSALSTMCYRKNISQKDNRTPRTGNIVRIPSFFGGSSV